MDSGQTATRLDKLQKIGGIGNWELDLATGKAVWSEGACRIFGLEPTNNIISQSEWVTFIHPADREMVVHAFKRSLATQQNYEVQYRIIRPDGSLRHAYAHVEFIITDGKPTGLYGILNDITEIVLLKNELLKSGSNLQLMMDLIPVSIYARDADGYYIFANHIFLKHYGITYEDLKGKHLRDFVRSEEEYNILLAQDQAVLTGNEKLFISEFRQANVDGKLKIWQIIKVPFTPEGHTQCAVLGIAEDITERRLNEERLEEIARTLAERNKTLEQYSFMVSHDLRGPLSTLMGMAELIRDFPLSQEDLAIFLQGARASLENIDSIVKKMNEVLAAGKQCK